MTYPLGFQHLVRDISAGFLRMKDKMLKIQRICHGQNAENPPDMSRRGIIKMYFQTQSGHFRWVFSILYVTFPLGFQLYVFQSQKPSGNVTAFKIHCVDGTVRGGAGGVPGLLCSFHTFFTR